MLPDIRRDIADGGVLQIRRTPTYSSTACERGRTTACCRASTSSWRSSSRWTRARQIAAHVDVVRTDRLTKDFSTGFWRPRPHRALDGLSFEIPAGRRVRPARTERRRQEHHAQAAARSAAADVGPRRAARPAAGRCRARTAARLSAGEPDVLRPSLRRGTARVLCRSLRLSARGAPRARRALLDRVGLGADRRRPLRQYSKGMVQRVGLAQALVNDPELVILDEPMSGLDPVGRREVREMISACATRAARCSSARTSCRTPSCSAAASASSRGPARGGGDRRRADGRRGDATGMGDRRGRRDRAAVARLGPRVERVTRSPTAATASSSARSARPGADHRRLLPPARRWSR